MSYSSLPLSSKLFQFTALTLALTLAGCGGGGTDTIAPEPDTGVTQPGTGGDNGTGPTVGEIKITPINLTDSNGNITRTVTSAGASAKVTVTDSAGEPVSNALVSFQAEGVIFGNSNSTVLTNENGEASISIKPADNTNTGSYQLSATVDYNDLTKTTPGYNFSLQSIEVLLTNFVLSNNTLASGSKTNITLKTKDAANNVFQNDITVNFDTSCGSFDASSVVSSNQGDVTATYTAIDASGNLCAGQQSIIATPANNPANKQTMTVNIAGVEASSVVYTTTEKVQLGASNSGSSNSGQIEFTVYANGRPAANQQVEISKNFAPEDFSFVTLNNKDPKPLTSDSQGKVVVDLYPGVKPGPVEIKATLKLPNGNSTNITALSKDVSVATGRATQNGFSISMTKNVLAFDVDGDASTITARLVDRVGNPVPDGTVVSFVSEGGRVTPNCTTSKGSCDVEFTTQNPRPTDNRATVIAYVEGDKNYTDMDGDNKFSVGDVLTHNIGDFFRDDNENNQYDKNLGEFVYRRGLSGATCAPSTLNQPNDGVFNGKSTCDNGLAATLRYQFVLGLASSNPVFDGLSNSLPANSVENPKKPITRNFKMYGNSALTVSMPSGTTIDVAATDKTDYTPVAELVNGRIQVSKAEPNTIAIVKSGSTSVNVPILANGTGSASTTLPAGSTLSVVDTNVTCEAELISGNKTVPKVISLGNNKVQDKDVLYTLIYNSCRPNDQIKVTVVTPSPSANTTVKTIVIE